MDEEEIITKYFQNLSAMDFVRHYLHFNALLETLEAKREFRFAASLATIEAQHYKHISEIKGLGKENIKEAKKYTQKLVAKVLEYERKAR